MPKHHTHYTHDLAIDIALYELERAGLYEASAEALHFWDRGQPWPIRNEHHCNIDRCLLSQIHHINNNLPHNATSRPTTP